MDAVVSAKNRNNRNLPGHRVSLLAFTIAMMSSASLAPLQLSAAEVTDTQTAAINFAIAPGPMAATLNKFASSAGITLSFDPAHLQSLRSGGLQGRYSIADGLKVILTGFGLQASRTPSGAYLITSAPQNSFTPALPTVLVSAAPTLTEVENTLSYNREHIEKQNPQDIKDVFRKDPRIAVGGSIAANQKVYVRGVEETAMAVSIDGARQNNKVFHHNTTNLIDPALLKTVRASAGVAPASDGPGALGGSIIYETVGVADILESGDNFGGFANAGYRTNGEVINTSGSVMGRTNGFEFLAFANRSDGRDYDDGNSDKVRFTGPALTSGLVKFAFESAQAGRLEFSHELANDDGARPYRANLVSVQGRPVPESRNYDLTRRNTIFQYSKNSGGLWNPSIMLADSETEVITTEIPLRDPNAVIIYTGTTSSQSAKLQNTFNTPFAAISAGADFYDDSAIFEYATDPTLKERAKNIGMFAQVRHPIGKLAKLSYGVRYDDQTFTGTDGTRFDEQGGSANISGDLQLGHYASLSAGYAKVWGGVALGENYILNGAWDYSRAILPAESDNYSVGVKTQYNGILFDANIFTTDIKNGRTPTWAGGPDLVADFLIEGFDAAITYVGTRGEIGLSYADIDAEKDGTTATSYNGSYFTSPLGRLIALNGELHFYDSRVELGVNVEKALENNSVRENGRSQRGYLVINAFANYRLSDNLTLRVAVDNLADKAYVDRASYGQEFTDVIPIYEPGRTVGINLRYEF
jgi:Outer membrane receptor proteins, mostly Fe transport